MRIVIATTTGFHLCQLTREFVSRGCDVRYHSYMPMYRIRRSGIPEANAESLFWQLQPSSTAALFRLSRAIQAPAVQRMLELTDDAIAESLQSCDVFIGLSGMAVKSATVAKQRFGAKVVIERGSRHVLSQNALLSEAGGSPLPLRYIERELASYDAADVIALPSGHAVQSFVDAGFQTEQLFLNPYGVNFDRFSPSPVPPKPVKLLFLGGWSFQKGVDVLTAALEQLPECTLTHVGTRADWAYPKSDRFHALGHIESSRLPQIFAEHHALVLPSRQDGFGMVLLEALASGLPVIASSMTGGPDIRAQIGRKDAVELVTPGSVEELVRAVRAISKRLPAEGEPREILSADERNAFTWEAYATRYLTFLKELHKTRHASEREALGCGIQQ